MIPNNSEKFQPTGTHIVIPATNDVPASLVRPTPTIYDYLTLLPVLITALTPLILEFKKKKDADKEDDI
jgi:hypothetical protein